MSRSKASKKRREERTARRREAQEEHINNELKRGRLMWENNNGGDFSEEWLIPQLRKLMIGLVKIIDDDVQFLQWIQFHKDLIRDIILRWPEDLPHNSSYYILKTAIEHYWDYKDSGLSISVPLMNTLHRKELWEDLMDYSHLSNQ